MKLPSKELLSEVLNKKISNNSHKGCIESYIETNNYGIALVNGNAFTAETEPEAIFQACQWILEQRND